MTRHLSVPLEDQGEFLATRWMSVKQFEEAGILCRKGPFTKEEIQKIHDAIQMYQKENNLDDERLNDLIHSESSEPAKGFWSYIARTVPQRGVKSVFYHVRRARDSIGKAGKWSAAEDEQLRIAVQTHGKDWAVVADLVQRSAADCSDRFRQHTQYKETRRKGAWSSEEECQLLHTIEGLAQDGKLDMSARGFWVSVSKAMGATRTPKQCQSKWSDTLEGKARNEDKTRRWKEDDSYVLICKIASLDVDDEDDIDWKSLNDPAWNMWSSHYLQQKWRQLKASRNSDSTMCHRGGYTTFILGFPPHALTFLIDVVHSLVTRVSATRQTSTP
ncbi:hypothetical protein EDB84DRAFT_1435350 [Lactarius hengduanensis]|nr:hypothetical protein EDB84DRAFT_1435350 [Lactarius hengduanensis]